MSNKQDYTNYHSKYSTSHEDELLDSKIKSLRLKELNANFWDIMNCFPRDGKILEIWCWRADFAFYCQKQWFTSYTGYDYDNNAIDINREKFPEYRFSSDDVNIFLKANPNTLDCIFMSHVFEHLTKEQGLELATNIHNSLKTWGTWINIMPNAASLFSASLGRYCDFTHEILYTSVSFSRLLTCAGWNEDSVIHRNTRFRYMIFEYWQRSFRFLVSLLLRSLNYLVDKITTFELITIAIKK